MPPRPDSANRPVVALVLGGGGLRGFAHVGVLRALYELGVEPDIVVGTSAGAVVGAAYASGATPEQLQAVALDVELSSLVDLAFSREGLIRGDALARWIDAITDSVPIERFPRRFAAVATDLGSGQSVLLDSGPAGVVVQASAAVPGMNVPVPYHSGLLIDGGVTALVPVRFARALGADIVIAVDIYCQSTHSPGTSAASVVSRVMRAQSCLMAAPDIADADVLIVPMLAQPGASSSPQARVAAIRAGYDAARDAMAGLVLVGANLRFRHHSSAMWTQTPERRAR